MSLVLDLPPLPVSLQNFLAETGVKSLKQMANLQVKVLKGILTELRLRYKDHVHYLYSNARCVLTGTEIICRKDVIATGIASSLAAISKEYVERAKDQDVTSREPLHAVTRSTSNQMVQFENLSVPRNVDAFRGSRQTSVGPFLNCGNSSPKIPSLVVGAGTAFINPLKPSTQFINPNSLVHSFPDRFLDPAFRTPFFKTVVTNAARFVPIDDKQSCSVVKFSLNDAEIAQLYEAPARNLMIHVRLFRTSDNEHIQFEATGKYRIVINGAPITYISRIIRKVGSKKNAHVVIPALDITSEILNLLKVSRKYEFMVEVHCNGIFAGFVAIEFAEAVDVQVIVEKIKIASVPALSNKCVICGNLRDPLHPLNSNSKVLFCSEACKDSDILKVSNHPSQNLIPIVAVQASQSANAESILPPVIDEDLEIENSSISLRCPLLASKIRLPGLGKHCKHEQSFDLEGFLLYSHPSCLWVCPICSEPIQPNVCEFLLLC